MASLRKVAWEAFSLQVCRMQIFRGNGGCYEWVADMNQGAEIIKKSGVTWVNCFRQGVQNNSCFCENKIEVYDIFARMGCYFCPSF